VTTPGQQQNSCNNSNALPIITIPFYHLANSSSLPTLTFRTSAHHQNPFFAWWCFILPLKALVTPSTSLEHGFDCSPRCKKRERRGYLYPLMPTPVPLKHPFPSSLQPSRGIPHFLQTQYTTTPLHHYTHSIPRSPSTITKKDKPPY
jgi:hypothetical protein